MSRENLYAYFLLPLILLIAVTLACGEASPTPIITKTPRPTLAADVIPRRARVLEIDITTSESDDFEAAIAKAKSAGAQSVPLTIFWDQIETAPYEFNPDPNWLEVANAFYPATGLEVTLTISVLDTNTDRRPADLKNRPFDDPEVIARFNALLDYVAAQTPDVRFTALAIGNEIDGVLSNHADAWQQYTAFLEQTAAYAHSLWPGLPVGAKVMFDGARTYPAYIRPLWEVSDALMLTYYPLHDDFTVRQPDTVHDDFAEMVTVAQGKPVYLLELGYPSSPVCESSEAQQAEFIHQAFLAWDEHADDIALISFSWLTDLSPQLVEQFQKYYGIENKAFGEYLRTLGLRTWPGDGEDKPAFHQLQTESAARGW